MMLLEKDNRFKHIIYIDMDSLLPGEFSRKEPMPEAVEAVKMLAAHRRYDLYFLSTAPWENPSAWAEKLEWVKKHFDSDKPDGVFYKKLILTHHKDLCIQRRTWLIDDRKDHGSEHFGHHWIRIGSEEFPDWNSVANFFVGGAPDAAKRETRNQIWGTQFLSSLNEHHEERDRRFRPILYFDMDNVLVDFRSGLDKVSPEIKAQYEDDGTGKPHYDDIPGLFSLMEPMPGAIEAIKALAASSRYDLYILSTAPWGNPSAWSDKVEWVKKHLDSNRPDGVFYKRLILTHHKNLCIQPRAWLIDDRKAHGSEHFEHHWIPFGSDKFPDWDAVVNFFLNCETGSVMRMTRKKGWPL